MPKTTTVASSSSITSTNDDLYVRELPFITKDNFSDAQLKYLAEIPVKLGQKVYYIADEEKLTLFAEGIKEGKWLALLNNEDALHVALGAFMFDRKINYWELVTFIHIYQLAKKFRPSDLFGSFENNFRQHLLFKKDANDNLTWSDEALKMFVPGHYRMFELAAKKSLPPALRGQDPVAIEMVKAAADKKMRSLLIYIAEHCPVNQQFFIEFNDKALGFTFDNGATYVLSDIFMAMHRDQNRVDIAPCLPSFCGTKTIFHPFSLLNTIGGFVYQQDYVTPLPKLGLFGSRRLYGTAKVKEDFGVFDYRPVDLFFQSNIPNLLNPHNIKSSFHGVLIHDIWHCLSDSSIPSHKREFIKMMARALRDRKVELNNSLATKTEQAFIDKQDFYDKEIDVVLADILSLYSKIGSDINISNKDFILLIIFLEMATKRQQWIDRTTLDPWQLKFNYYGEDRFPHFEWMLEKVGEKSKTVSDFYELWLAVLTECCRELLQSTIGKSDKDRMYSLRRMTFFLHGLIERMPDHKVEIKALVDGLKKLTLEQVQLQQAEVVEVLDLVNAIDKEVGSSLRLAPR